MKCLHNKYFGDGMAELDSLYPSVAVENVSKLLSHCPAHSITPMVDALELAKQLNIERLWIKDERQRMGLSSFKALGAAYVIANDAMAELKEGDENYENVLTGRIYVTASAGNHGISVAAGARLFGAKAVIFLSNTVPAGFALRLKEKGADVIWAGEDYAESFEAAKKEALTQGWTLLSDTSWQGNMDIPYKLMEGYLQLADEALQQCDSSPTHCFLQAGVGGLASAVAAFLRNRLGNDLIIIVVEPQEAPALYEAIKLGKVVTTGGKVSCMGRLDCKEASLIALKGLSRDASAFMLIEEDEARAVLPTLASAGLATSPSGGAGFAGLAAAVKDNRNAFSLDKKSRVLLILSEADI